MKIHIIDFDTVTQSTLPPPTADSYLLLPTCICRGCTRLLLFTIVLAS